MIMDTNEYRKKGRPCSSICRLSASPSRVSFFVRHDERRTERRQRKCTLPVGARSMLTTLRARATPVDLSQI
jgi:hypothetical protein